MPLAARAIKYGKLLQPHAQVGISQPLINATTNLPPDEARKATWAFGHSGTRYSFVGIEGRLWPRVPHRHVVPANTPAPG